jgi:hypothetical protein
MRAFLSTRRGRPKQPAANDNEPDRGEPDRGTAELQAKRAALAQGVDRAAASHPLDLLLARGLIDAQEHRAGWRYAGLYRQLIGRTAVSYGRLYAGLAGEPGRMPAAEADPADLAGAQSLFRTAQGALRAEGAVVAGITERLAVFGAYPDWLLQQDTTRPREMVLLRRGLTRLVQSFRKGEGRKP